MGRHTGDIWLVMKDARFFPDLWNPFIRLFIIELNLFCELEFSERNKRRGASNVQIAYDYLFIICYELYRDECGHLSFSLLFYFDIFMIFQQQTRFTFWPKRHDSILCVSESGIIHESNRHLLFIIQKTGFVRNLRFR